MNAHLSLSLSLSLSRSLARVRALSGFYGVSAAWELREDEADGTEELIARRRLCVYPKPKPKPKP